MKTARRGLLLLGWGLVIAQAAIGIESILIAKTQAPITLASRLETLPAHAEQFEEDALLMGDQMEAADASGRPRFVPLQTLVRFRGDVDRPALESLVARWGCRLLRPVNVTRNVYLIELPEGEDPRDASKVLRGVEEVESALPNLLFYPN